MRTEPCVPLADTRAGAASHQAPDGRFRLQQEQNNVSCLNSRAIIEYVRRFHPERLADLLAAVPAPGREGEELETYLCDVNNWVTSACIVAMFTKAREISGNERAAFDIGYQSILHREFGYWQKILVRFFSSPRRILRRLNQLNARLNSTKTVELVSDSPSHAVVRWHWTEGAVASKDICLYNQGIYSAIPTVWGRPAARVEERTCWIDGHDYCEIHLSWTANWRALGGMLAGLFHRGPAPFLHHHLPQSLVDPCLVPPPIPLKP